MLTPRIGRARAVGRLQAGAEQRQIFAPPAVCAWSATAGSVGRYGSSVRWIVPVAAERRLPGANCDSCVKKSQPATEISTSAGQKDALIRLRKASSRSTLGDPEGIGFVVAWRSGKTLDAAICQVLAVADSACIAARAR